MHRRLKIQGIKTKLVPLIAANVNLGEIKGHWIEPFLGSGVVLLNINPARALIADTNVHIINFYKAIQDGALTADLVRKYLEYEGIKLKTHGAAHYYKIRSRFNELANPLDFLFLNRASFNGLMRFNQKGQFNVPFCKKPERFRAAYITKICNQIQWASDIIKYRDWEFICSDWRSILDRATDLDFIYADPPYSGRNADYYNKWYAIDNLELAAKLKSTPAKFIYSTWIENKYRRNDETLELF